MNSSHNLTLYYQFAKFANVYLANFSEYRKGLVKIGREFEPNIFSLNAHLGPLHCGGNSQALAQHRPIHIGAKALTSNAILFLNVWAVFRRHARNPPLVDHGMAGQIEVARHCGNTASALYGLIEWVF
jgi:hypothetical protein